MRPTLKLALLYFTLFPVQHWLAVAAVALLALGAAALDVRPNAGPAVLAAVLLLVPLVGTVGAVFQLLSTPSTHRFLPRFRRRLLTATGLVVCVATAMTVGIASLSYDPTPPIVVTVYAATAWSTLLWLPLFAPRSIFAFLPVVLAVWCVDRTIGLNADFLADAALAVGGALVVAWAAFAAWYLSPNARIRLHGVGLLGRAVNRLPVRPLDVSTGNAAEAFLWGPNATPGGRTMVLLSCAVGYGALAIVDPGIADGLRFTFGLPIVAAVLWLPALRAAASRARFLWLRDAPGRIDLFRTIERTMLRLELTGPAVIAIAVACVAAALVETPLRSIAGILACSAATGAAGAYIGLMCLRSDRVGDWFVGLAYGLGALIAFIAAATQPAHMELLLGIASAQAGCAVLCRRAALHRWRDIDWLALRPARIHRAA